MTGEKFKLIEIQNKINSIIKHGFGEVIIKITQGQITDCEVKFNHKWMLEKKLD